ncbi:MAG: PD40 domain-containing protein [Deltaproteobacteria bacterium]|nr:PD40 domain-containing protein [Deltaproteobacteria bacterium]
MTSQRGLPWILLATAVLAVASSPTIGSPGPASITVTAPRDGAIFPLDFAPPAFRWEDAEGASRWRVTIEIQGEAQRVIQVCEKREWRPAAEAWQRIKAASIGRTARFLVRRIDPAAADSSEPEASVSFQTAPDPVGAPILFREVPLPVAFAMDHKSQIRWKLGDVSSADPPRTVLTGMQTCANCHSSSADGRTLAMDIDFGSDKGTYAVVPVAPTVQIGRSDLVTWNDFRPYDGERTLGFLSTISPDGRYLVSTVKETLFLKFLPDPYCSQLFFPTRGILVSYERSSKSFHSLSGADSPDFVQTNPAFSPDGRWLLFARARVPEIPRNGSAIDPDVISATAPDFIDGSRKICFDLYRMPFNRGLGGAPERIPGASANGQSNFFARYSPDGRWIVFCQASSMMLNRPDSSLYIIPAEGGAPRRLRCNAPGRMNSWHSFSPNGRWLVYASKATGPFTQLWLAHIDATGQDSIPVQLEGWVESERAANIPEFVNLSPGAMREIIVATGIRDSKPSLPRRPN